MAKISKKEGSKQPQFKTDSTCREYVHNHCLKTVNHNGTSVAQLCNVEAKYCVKENSKNE